MGSAVPVLSLQCYADVRVSVDIGVPCSSVLHRRLASGELLRSTECVAYMLHTEPYPRTPEFFLVLLLVFALHNKIFVKLKQVLFVSSCRHLCNSHLDLVVELTIYPA